MHLKTLVSILYNRSSLILAVACSGFVPAMAPAAITPFENVSLEWDANFEPDIAGYKVYVGTESGSYPSVINVVGSTKVALPKVNLGTTLHIAVSAFNFEGIEGPLSSELVVIADVPAPAASTSFTMNSPGQGQIQWKYPKNAAVSPDRFTVYASEDLVNWVPASDVLISESASSDAEWLYFDFPYAADKPRMFFQVAAANAFGEIR